MITGARLVLLSTDPAADRAFLRDTLGLSDGRDGAAGPSFALRAVDIAVRPGRSAPDDGAERRFCLTVDDLDATLAQLAARGVAPLTRPLEVGEGKVATIPLPSGGVVELLEPRRPTAEGSDPGSADRGRSDGMSSGRPGNRFATDRDSDPA